VARRVEARRHPMPRNHSLFPRPRCRRPPQAPTTPGQPAGRCSVRRPVRVRTQPRFHRPGARPTARAAVGRDRAAARPARSRPGRRGPGRSARSARAAAETRPRSSYARGRMGGAQTQSPAGRAPGARPPAAAPGRTRRLPAGRSGPAGRRARARLGPRTGPEEPSGGATAPRRQGPARRPILSRSDEIPAPPRSDPGRC